MASLRNDTVFTQRVFYIDKDSTKEKMIFNRTVNPSGQLAKESKKVELGFPSILFRLYIV